MENYFDGLLKNFDIEEIHKSSKDYNAWVTSRYKRIYIKPIMRQLGVYQIKSRKKKWKQNK